MLVAPQIALVAGTLAAWRGLELYVVDFSQRLPAWWLGLMGGLAAIAAASLFAASGTLVRARAIVSSAPGQAGRIDDDLPVPGSRWLRTRPWLLGAVAGLAAAIGFVLLGRSVGARR